MGRAMQEVSTRLPESAHGPGTRTAIAARIAAGLLRAAGSPAVALELPSGERVCTAATVPVATFRLADRAALLRLATSPERQFAELHVEGRLTLVAGDLVAGLRELLLAQAVPLAPPCGPQAVPRGWRLRQQQFAQPCHEVTGDEG
jgi:hypothetical protein